MEADEDAFYVGDVWKPVVTITDPESDEALVDPDEVTVVVGGPNGAEAPTERVSQGRYRAEIDLIAAGVCRIVVKTAGRFKAAKPADIVVLDPFGAV